MLLSVWKKEEGERCPYYKVEGLSVVMILKGTIDDIVYLHIFLSSASLSEIPKRNRWFVGRNNKNQNLSLGLWWNLNSLL